MLKGSATIEDLHRSWSFSTSIKNIAFAGKYFNLIALAALTTKLTIIDSTLMQKAFSTYVGTDVPVNVTNIIGYVNETIPVTSSPQTGRSPREGMSKALNLELQKWSQQGTVYDSLFRGCEGTCYLQVPAAGFEFDCGEPIITEIDYGKSTAEATALQGDISSMTDGSAIAGGSFLTPNSSASDIAKAQAYVADNFVATMFKIEFKREDYSPEDPAPDGSEYSYITMDMLSTVAQDVVVSSDSNAKTRRQDSNSGVCPGTATRQTCKLRPAVVSYPLQITNYTGAHALNGIKLGTPHTQGGNESHVVLEEEPYDISLKQQGGFRVLRHQDIKGPLDGSVERLGGLALGLQTYLGGNASFFFAGAVGFSPEINGGAYKYSLNAGDLGRECGYQWINPLDPGNRTDSLTQSVVTSINQIMLLNTMKVGVTDPNGYDTSLGPLPATTFNATMYRDTVHYSTNKWYMIGAVISNFICVLCVLPSYWGFWQLGRKVALSPFEIAAAFRSPMVNTGGTIDDILRENGSQPVQFGRIVTGDAAGQLGVAEPEFVERAHPAIGSAKREINATVTGVFSKRATQ